MGIRVKKAEVIALVKLDTAESTHPHEKVKQAFNFTAHAVPSLSTNADITAEHVASKMAADRALKAVTSSVARTIISPGEEAGRNALTPPAQRGKDSSSIER